MQRLFFLTIGLVFPFLLEAQINPQNITIARDQWGVPHIFAPKDAEVAYGLAWATAEDDFGSIQEHLLASLGRLAEVKGKSGAILDVVGKLIGLQELVDSAYREDTFSPEYRKVLLGYIQGLNDYAAAHPKEVWIKKTFPITEKDMVRANIMGYCLFTGLERDLTKIFTGLIKAEEAQVAYGSNALALAPSKTKDGKTYLAINSHQPLEGPFSWYETHLQSEEGWDILGGALPGSIGIGHGVNRYLGWAHTVNHPDLTDIYKLEMNPNNPRQYKFDGQWETLRERKVKIKVKVGPIKFGKKFKFFWSKYGATMEKNGSYYSLRFAGNMRIKAPEQHYWMNKARNLDEFKKALNLQYLPSFNIVYADREGNILYLNNGLIPYRQAGFDWTQVLPGNTSKTLWENRFHPLQDLPQVLNPSSGYVFNTNNSPFNATAPPDNLDAEKYDIRMGHIRYDNNRSTRLQSLISSYDKLSYDDFKTIKYDWQYPKPLKFSIITNLEDLFSLDPGTDQSLAPILKQIQSWDRKNQPSSKGAGAFTIFLHKLGDMLRAQGRLKPGNKVTTDEMRTALREAQSHLQEFFGRTEVSLGDLQRHQRGEVDLPIGGAFDVLAAMYAEPVKKKGTFRATQGESYILLARFDENGPILESVNAYGTSSREDSPHFTDQMQLFVDRKLKKMSMDKEEILKNAKRVYHPGE